MQPLARAVLWGLMFFQASLVLTVIHNVLRRHCSQKYESAWRNTGGKQPAPGKILGIRRGDVIGALGFTGSASAPHLHFHIADRPSLLGTEGQPFVFSEFEQIGAYPSMEAVGSGPWSGSHGSDTVERAMPDPSVVIMFEE